MAGANYMGGGRNTAKARSKDVTGRLQKGHFQRQRIDSLAKALSGSRIQHGLTEAPSQQIELAHAQRASKANVQLPLTGPRPSTPPPRKRSKTDKYTLSSSVKSDRSSSCASRVLTALDTTEPIAMRAEMDRLLKFSDFAGISHAIPRIQTLPRENKKRKLEDADSTASGQAKKQRCGYSHGASDDLPPSSDSPWRSSSLLSAPHMGKSLSVVQPQDSRNTLNSAAHYSSVHEDNPVSWSNRKQTRFSSPDSEFASDHIDPSSGALDNRSYSSYSGIDFYRNNMLDNEPSQRTVPVDQDHGFHDFIPQERYSSPSPTFRNQARIYPSHEFSNGSVPPSISAPSSPGSPRERNGKQSSPSHSSSIVDSHFHSWTSLSKFSSTSSTLFSSFVQRSSTQDGEDIPRVTNDKATPQISPFVPISDPWRTIGKLLELEHSDDDISAPEYPEDIAACQNNSYDHHSALDYVRSHPSPLVLEDHWDMDRLSGNQSSQRQWPLLAEPFNSSHPPLTLTQFEVLTNCPPLHAIDEPMLHYDTTQSTNSGVSQQDGTACFLGLSLEDEAIIVDEHPESPKSTHPLPTLLPLEDSNEHSIATGILYPEELLQDTNSLQSQISNTPMIQRGPSPGENRPLSIFYGPSLFFDSPEEDE